MQRAIVRGSARASRDSIFAAEIRGAGTLEWRSHESPSAARRPSWSARPNRRFRPYTKCRRPVARRLYRDSRAALTPDPPPGRSRLASPRSERSQTVPIRYYRRTGGRQGEPFPALVSCHGGGWVMGDLDTHDVVCRILATGLVGPLLSVEYRKAPDAPFPSAVEDCFAATQFVAAQATSVRHRCQAHGRQRRRCGREPRSGDRRCWRATPADRRSRFSF